jgi:serine/threonine protein phosphatase 1
MDLPDHLDYPVVAVGDLHGQREELERLVARIEGEAGWRDAAFVFLGDLVDRGPDVRGAIDLVIELIGGARGGSAVMGNHDLGLVRATGLDDASPSPYWVERYLRVYDASATFRSYLGVEVEDPGPADLARLRAAIPASHRRFLATLPWVVELEGHLLLHNGLSPELEVSADEQVAALHDRDWNRERLRPRPGTGTFKEWKEDYPVWLGADRKLSARPLLHPSKVQVSGHVMVVEPDANDVRIRIDTSGGKWPPLTACLLEGPGVPPRFLASRVP